MGPIAAAATGSSAAGVHVAKAAAQGASIARLLVTDVMDRLRQQRTPASNHLGALHRALCRHGADAEDTVLDRNIPQSGRAIEVD